MALSISAQAVHSLGNIPHIRPMTCNQATSLKFPGSLTQPDAELNVLSIVFSHFIPNLPTWPRELLLP